MAVVIELISVKASVVGNSLQSNALWGGGLPGFIESVRRNPQWEPDLFQFDMN